jgi:hypothetical protein
MVAFDEWMTKRITKTYDDSRCPGLYSNFATPESVISLAEMLDRLGISSAYIYSSLQDSSSSFTVFVPSEIFSVSIFEFIFLNHHDKLSSKV